MKKLLLLLTITGCASAPWGHSTLISSEENNSGGDKWYLSTCSNLDSCFRDMERTCDTGKISYRSPQQEDGVYHVMYECVTAPRPQSDKTKGVIDGLFGH